MNKKILQLIVALTVSFFLFVLADLVPFWMPMMGQMVSLLVASVLLTVWVGFVMLEDAHDERELVLKMQAGRVAYLSGIGVLLIGLIVQGMQHAIDPWVALALAAMVLAKLCTRFYFE